MALGLTADLKEHENPHVRWDSVGPSGSFQALARSQQGDLLSLVSTLLNLDETPQSQRARSQAGAVAQWYSICPGHVAF